MRQPVTAGKLDSVKWSELEEMEAANKKWKGMVLDKTEMLVVIEVWKEIVLVFCSASKNAHIYKKMCEELNNLGVILTAVVLKNRVHNLTRKYRLVIFEKFK